VNAGYTTLSASSGSGKYGAVHTGELFGTAPTSRETEVRTHDFHEIVDGRIVRTHDMED
jgi:SnoaL-like polyketide cyclase